RLICLAAVRFQSGEVPGGAVDMLVAELERRGSAQAAALLGGFAKLGAPMLAEPAKAARARLAADGVTVGPLEEELGALRAVDVRCAELLRAQLWTFEIERVDAPGVQAAAVALEHDGDGLIVARGLLTGPLGAAETIDSFRPGGPDVEDAARAREEAAQALGDACAHSRELGLAVPYELALALPLIGRALGLEPATVTGLLVAPEGEPLWAP